MQSIFLLVIIVLIIVLILRINKILYNFVEYSKRDPSLFPNSYITIVSTNIDLIRKYFNKNSNEKYSRRLIEAKLKKLYELPPPKIPTMFATCYSGPVQFGGPKYICPVCGNKTNYQSSGGGLLNDIIAIRRMIGEIKGINIGLNEESLCLFCSPDVSRRACIVYVNIEGEKFTTEIINPEIKQIKALKAFLDDETYYNDTDRFRTNLIDVASTIEQIFGISPNKNKK